MPDSPPLVQFKDVTKRYSQGPLVLDRITLEARTGDFISLIGPSGCGKSTLLRLIAGLSPVTSGSLRLGGPGSGAVAPELGFVFQEPALLPWLTVAKNVELAQRLAGRTAAQRTAAREQALARVGLSEHASYYPRQLSGGQKMRVSIARALTLSPEILLLDEPFGALDEMTRGRLNEELLALRGQQAWTAFFVTHSVAEAVFLSNRIVIMSAHPGRLHTEVPVDLPYPRTAETRLTPVYYELVATVSRLLRSVERAA